MDRRAEATAVMRDDLAVRRTLRALRTRLGDMWQRRADTPSGHAEIAALSVGTRAYREGVAAMTCGDYEEAAAQLRIASGHGIGDAVVRLAVVLEQLGEHSAARAWWAVAEVDGHAVMPPLPRQAEEAAEAGAARAW
ncbi:hypothetical protein [Crossiella equi]|nr:hypothetical protein [Crossiella equi]